MPEYETRLSVFDDLMIAKVRVLRLSDRLAANPRETAGRHRPPDAPGVMADLPRPPRPPRDWAFATVEAA